MDTKNKNTSSPNRRTFCTKAASGTLGAALAIGTVRKAAAAPNPEFINIDVRVGSWDSTLHKYVVANPPYDMPANGDTVMISGGVKNNNSGSVTGDLEVTGYKKSPTTGSWDVKCDVTMVVAEQNPYTIIGSTFDTQECEITSLESVGTEVRFKFKFSNWPESPLSPIMTIVASP